MSEILAGHNAGVTPDVPTGDEPVVYEGLAAELPPVEPTVADLAAIEAGCWEGVQERLEYLDLLEAHRVAAERVDELSVRRARRERARILAAAIRPQEVA